MVNVTLGITLCVVVNSVYLVTNLTFIGVKVKLLSEKVVVSALSFSHRLEISILRNA